MGIQWGVLLGNAAKSGVGVYDQMETDKLKQMQYATQKNQLDNTMGLQQDLAQLDPNSPTYNQDVQTAMTRRGDPLKASQFGTSNAQGEGLKLKNDQTRSILDVGRQAHEFYNGITKQVGGGDIAGGAMTIANKARELNLPVAFDQTGTKMSVMGPNGQPSGQTYDLSDPHVQYAAAGFLQNAMIKSGLLQADPTMLPQVQNSDSQALSAQARMQDSNVNVSQSPSVIARNQAGANASNAEASLAPARAGALNAQAAAAGSTANTNAQLMPLRADLLRAQAAGANAGVGLTNARSEYYKNRPAPGSQDMWIADPNQPNSYINRSKGIVVQTDRKTGAVARVTQLGGGQAAPAGTTRSQSGVVMAKNKAGQTGYQGGDGHWYGSEAEALHTFTPQASAPQQQARTAALQPPIPSYPGMAGAGEEAPMPGAYDDADY
jgi:hypothetical protein